MQQIADIDSYIAQAPTDLRTRLQAIRATIRRAAPKCTEAISYGMPTFKLDGKNLVHFAYWKTHIGFYPTPGGITPFMKELVPYVVSKGSVQFPHNSRLPLGLVRKMVQLRVRMHTS